MKQPNTIVGFGYIPGYYQFPPEIDSYKLKVTELHKLLAHGENFIERVE